MYATYLLQICAFFGFIIILVFVCMTELQPTKHLLPYSIYSSTRKHAEILSMLTQITTCSVEAIVHYVVKTTSSFQNHRVHWHFKAIVQCTFEAMFIYIYHVFIFYNTLIASVQFSVFRSKAGSIYTVMFDYSIHLVRPALFLTGNGCAKSVHSISCVWQISSASEVHCMCFPTLGPGNLELIISFFRQMPQEHLMFYCSLITLIVMQNIYNGSCFSPKFFCLCSSKIKEPIDSENKHLTALKISDIVHWRELLFLSQELTSVICWKLWRYISAAFFLIQNFCKIF